MESDAPSNRSPAREDVIEALGRILARGGRPGDLYGLQQEHFEMLYAMGHQMYSQARYRDAAIVFGYLSGLDGRDARFFNALASSLQMLGCYDDAITLHALASLEDLDDPKPTLHAAECLIAVGRLPEATEMLENVVADCVLPELAPFKERAEALKGLIAAKRHASQGAAA